MNYTIGALGEATGERPKTLRYWTEQGLLNAGRTAANYRRYGPEAPGQVAFIRSAQAAGFTLRDIRALLELAAREGKPCIEVKTLAQARLAAVQAQLCWLRRMEAELIRVATLQDENCPPGCCTFLPGP